MGISLLPPFSHDVSNEQNILNVTNMTGWNRKVLTNRQRRAWKRMQHPDQPASQSPSTAGSLTPSPTLGVSPQSTSEKNITNESAMAGIWATMNSLVPSKTSRPHSSHRKQSWRDKHDGLKHKAVPAWKRAQNRAHKRATAQSAPLRKVTCSVTFFCRPIRLPAT